MENAYVLQVSDTKFKDLYLCFCGYAECEPFHSFGPAVRPNYIIHFILEGKGTYQVGEQKYALRSGQGFLIEPETLTFYKADNRIPWTYLWIGFAGEQAEEYLKDIGLNSKHLTFQSDYGKELRNIVLQMLKHNTSSISNQYYLQSLLYSFFSVLTRDVTIESNKEESKESLYIEKAIQFIRNNYSSGIKVTDIADYVCVNRSYLYKLFRSNLDLSPQEFLNKFRISRARELLMVSDLSIESVAKSCGYTEALVFSKVFKKEHGIPPSVYRKIHKKEIQENLNRRKDEIDEMIDGNILTVF